jgi:hypothetical protein
MPIFKVSGGYRWGHHGKVYRNRSDAVKQAQAAHAAGYVSPGERKKAVHARKKKDRDKEDDKS